MAQSRARVQQRSEGEALAEALAHQPQTVEISSSSGRGGLRLDPDDGAIAAFEDHVDLVPISVTKVKGTRRIGIDARLTHELHHDERLDQRIGELRIGPDTLGVRAEQVRQQAAIDNVQLRRAMPRTARVRIACEQAKRIGALTRDAGSSSATTTYSSTRPA